MTDEDAKILFLDLLRSKNLKVGDAVLGPWLSSLFNGTDLEPEQLQRVSNQLHEEGLLNSDDTTTVLTQKGFDILL